MEKKSNIMFNPLFEFLRDQPINTNQMVLQTNQYQQHIPFVKIEPQSKLSEFDVVKHYNPVPNQSPPHYSNEEHIVKDQVQQYQNNFNPNQQEYQNQEQFQQPLQYTNQDNQENQYKKQEEIENDKRIEPNEEIMKPRVNDELNEIIAKDETDFETKSVASTNISQMYRLVEELISDECSDDSSCTSSQIIESLADFALS